MPVLLPVDHLAELWPEKLRGARIGALLHPASVSAKLEHTSLILEKLNGELLRLAAFFGPQHGFLGQTQDNMIEWQSYEHPRLGIPVYSLYGEHREPAAEMLRGLDALIVDLQDIGARYYTFIWTLYLCLRACEKHGVAVIVCDRPNPLNGLTIEGPLLDSNYKSFVGMHPIPVRHGRTIGELARQFGEEAFPNCRLSVLQMKNWERAMWFDQTGLPWVIPSPNMPTLDTATVYPGMCLLEATNISEGRGTTRPFEIFGAPFIDAEKLCHELNALSLPGVFFRQNYFQPTFHKFAVDATPPSRNPKKTGEGAASTFASELCGGAQLHVLDRQSFRPVETGIEVIRCIRKLHADKFAWRQPPYEYEHEKLPIEILLGRPLNEFFAS